MKSPIGLMEGLFGRVRHKGLIPWDDDADVVFYQEDKTRLLALTEEFASHGLILRKEWSRLFEESSLFSAPSR